MEPPTWSWRLWPGRAGSCINYQQLSALKLTITTVSIDIYRTANISNPWSSPNMDGLWWLLKKTKLLGRLVPPCDLFHRRQPPWSRCTLSFVTLYVGSPALKGEGFMICWKHLKAFTEKYWKQLIVDRTPLNIFAGLAANLDTQWLLNPCCRYPLCSWWRFPFHSLTTSRTAVGVWELGSDWRLTG